MSDFFNSNAGSVVVDSPGSNSTQGPSVLVKARASELGAEVSRMEVWDLFDGKSTKLGNVFSKTIDQAFAVAGNGSHLIAVQDIGAAPDYKFCTKGRPISQNLQTTESL